MEEKHVYNHFDDDGPRVSAKVEKNSKGHNYEAHVSGARTPQQAIDLLHETMAALRNSYGENATA